MGVSASESKSSSSLAGAWSASERPAPLLTFLPYKPQPEKIPVEQQRYAWDSRDS